MVVWDIVWLWLGIIGTSILIAISFFVWIYSRKGLDTLSILYLLTQMAVQSTKTGFWYVKIENKPYFVIPDLILCYSLSALFWLFFYDFRLIFVTVKCENMEEYQH